MLTLSRPSTVEKLGEAGPAGGLLGDEGGIGFLVLLSDKQQLIFIICLLWEQ